MITLPNTYAIECPSCGQPTHVSTSGRHYIMTHKLSAPSKPEHLKPECSASRTWVSSR